KPFAASATSSRESRRETPPPRLFSRAAPPANFFLVWRLDPPHRGDGDRGDAPSGRSRHRLEDGAKARRGLCRRAICPLLGFAEGPRSPRPGAGLEFRHPGDPGGCPRRRAGRVRRSLSSPGVLASNRQQLRTSGRGEDLWTAALAVGRLAL